VTSQRIDFDRWAGTYDRTRGISLSVLRPILVALGPSAGRALLDIGGGTGNFAAAFIDAGFRTTLCDVSVEMAARAGAKGIGAMAASAEHLPFRDRSFDCAVSINVARHIADRLAAYREALRVLRAGPFVVKVSTEETQRGDWVVEYFPTLLERQPRYQPEAEIVDELRGAGFAAVEVRRFVYEDSADGSFQALKRFPDHLLDDEAARNTAVLQRLPEAGLERMRRDRESGALSAVIARYAGAARTYGDGSIFIASV
jgi:ubiquinone/menaquinone biosynthesis C-methylase UbiE